MTYARPLDRPLSDEDLTASCLESSTLAQPPRYALVRDREHNGADVENPLSGSFSHIAKLSYGETGTGNTIIQGENLRVLKALQTQYSGKIRCVYIDPPYNNQEQYRHYLDTRTHEAWLDMMVTRLHAIKPLLSIDGSLWISIDDRELHYLKVAADEVFGRENFVTTIILAAKNDTRESKSILKQP